MRTRRIFCQAAWGLAVGTLFVLIRGLPFFLPVQIPRGGRVVLESLNYPATWLAHFWAYGLELPSDGELGRELLVPSAFILGQWILVAFAVGWGCLRTANSAAATGACVPRHTN